jgi:hypothetical protein
MLLTVTGSSFILLLVLVILVVAVAFGLFTVRGSGISLTPTDGRGEAPGARGPSDVSGVDHDEGSATGSDLTGTSDPQHGTK